MVWHFAIAFEPWGSRKSSLRRVLPGRTPTWARSAGLPLRIAAKIPREESQFFKEQIEPLLDGQKVQFVGEVNDSRKAAFLSQAKALLFPIDWPEPFGLVMIEAMACGTPVIAFPSGSVPEILTDGQTGFIVNNDEEAVDAIACISDIERRGVRAEFERRFSARRMAEDYVRCYSDLVSRSNQIEGSIVDVGRSRQQLQYGSTAGVIIPELRRN
jgi:glycosyltransferase involved in cell wall biosynthesis